MHFVGNLLLFQQLKDFENPLRTDKVIAMSLVYYFLGHSHGVKSPTQYISGLELSVLY